jgi:hypothetical protein
MKMRNEKRSQLQAKCEVLFDSIAAAVPTTSDSLALTDHDRDFLRNLKIEIPDNARWPLDGDTEGGYSFPESTE